MGKVVAFVSPEFEDSAENLRGKPPNQGSVRKDLGASELETRYLCLQDSDCLVELDNFRGSPSRVAR